ncbi:hypothetical protein CRENBAI_000016 [Crenichthys baileyi]|uniref:Uncharacterized protein n=1 Tax=Crenichthys baileyi TaxID=28760 RepID=A0AAV9SSX3_9TELE
MHHKGKMNLAADAPQPADPTEQGKGGSMRGTNRGRDSYPVLAPIAMGSVAWPDHFHSQHLNLIHHHKIVITPGI